MPDDADAGFFRNLSGLATEYVRQKRRTLAAGDPETNVDATGGGHRYNFGGQEITFEDLRDVKDIRDSGGQIATLIHSKALLNFGEGAEVHVEDDEDTAQLVDGEELTLSEWLETVAFPKLDLLVLDLGEDALSYPCAVGEIQETVTGDFKRALPAEPWTIIPITNEKGEVEAYQQRTKAPSGGYTEQTLAAEDMWHIVVNKASARDQTGISEVLRNSDEIRAFKENEQAINQAIELHGFPQRHIKVGREDGAPVSDGDLRRVRGVFDPRTSDANTAYFTGQDVDVDTLEAHQFDYTAIHEMDMRNLTTALGLPLEAGNVGADGLGSGKPAELRFALLKLAIKANQRSFSVQFVERVMRPVIRDYSPFDHNATITLDIADPLEDIGEVADLINSIGDYMTNEEIRNKLDMPAPEDEEIAEGYRSPADIEAPEDEGPFGGGGGLFRDAADGRVLSSVPDNAVSISDRSEAPEGAQIITGPGGGLYYVPGADGDGEDDAAADTDEVTADPEDINDYDPDALNEGDEVIIEDADGNEFQAEVDLVGEDDVFVVDSEGKMTTMDRETGEFPDDEFTATGMVNAPEVDVTEVLKDGNLPTNPSDAVDRLVGGFDDMTEDEKQSAADNWNDILTDEAFEDLDPERAEAVSTARQQLEDNEAFQELVGATDGISDEVIFFDAEGADTTGFNPAADSERKAGVTWVHNNVLGTTNTDPEPPEPGAAVSSSDMASVLRHEYAHDVWDELGSEQRKSFQQDLPDATEISDGLTDYATERPEEAFTELVATTTHPEYDAEKFPDWVNNMADEYTTADALDIEDEPAPDPELKGLPTPEDVDDGNVTPETVGDLEDALPSDFDSDDWQAEPGGAFPNKGEAVAVDGQVGVMTDAEMLDNGEIGLVVTTPEGEKTVSEQDITHTFAGDDIEMRSHTLGRCLGEGVTDQELAHAPEWDRPLLEMHRGITDPDSDPNRALVDFAASGTPEFVLERIRDAIMGGALFSDFEDIPSADLMAFRQEFADALGTDNFTLDDVTERVMDFGDLPRGKAERIARTETSAVLNTAREEGYQERGESDALFYWTGASPGDHRQTAACEWLIRQTNPFENGTPRPLEELRDMLKEAPEHDDEMDDNLARPGNWVVHPNERSTFSKAPPGWEDL